MELPVAPSCGQPSSPGLQPANTRQAQGRSFSTQPTSKRAEAQNYFLASNALVFQNAPMPFKPFNSGAELHVHRGNLPHWRQWGTTYFITARLADSLPNRVLTEWRLKRDAWLQEKGASSPRDLPEELRSDYHREFTQGFHKLLDAGHGACLLARQDCAEALITRMLAGHPKAHQLDAWCLMPNHFHALIEPNEGVTLGEIVRHWKGGSSYDINKLLDRAGSLWQKETFDHIVRSEAQLRHYQRYIADNPAKAGLQAGYVLGQADLVDVSPEAIKRGSP